MGSSDRRVELALALPSSPNLASLFFRIFLYKLIIIILSRPGILQTIFDGIQRPLETIAQIS